jgi:hypothetical protein
MLILDTYHLDTLYVSQQVCEDPWLFFESKRGPPSKKNLGNTELPHKHSFQMFTGLAHLTNLAEYEPHTEWLDLRTIAYKDPSKTKRPHELRVNTAFRQKPVFEIRSTLVHYATQFLSTVRFPAHIRILRSINYETNQLTYERNKIVKELLRF